MKVSIKACVVLMMMSAAATLYLVKRYMPTEVVKTVEHTTTYTRTIQSPDGTRINDTVTTTDVTTDKVVPKTVQKSKYFVTAGYAYNIPNYKPEYQFSANKRILGNIFFGVTANTVGTVGIQVGMEF